MGVRVDRSRDLAKRRLSRLVIGVSGRRLSADKIIAPMHTHKYTVHPPNYTKHRYPTLLLAAQREYPPCWWHFCPGPSARLYLSGFPTRTSLREMASISVDEFSYGMFWGRFAMRGRCLTTVTPPNRPRAGAVLGMVLVRCSTFRSNIYKHNPTAEYVVLLFQHCFNLCHPDISGPAL